MKYYTGYLGLGKRVIAGEQHWEEATETTSLLGRKVVLCLPGNGTKDAKAANGMCKAIEEMLSEEARRALGENIYSVYYSKTGRDFSETEFFNRHLLPFIVKDSAYGKSYDELDIDDALPIKEAKRNMRNLIIFTHCQGSAVIAEFEMYFRQGLKRLGYSDEGRAEVMRQMFILHANDLHQHFGLTKATVMHRISQNDNIAGYHFDKLGRHMHTYNLDKDFPVAWFSAAKNEGVFLFATTGGNDHNGGFWKKENMTPFAFKGYELSAKVLDYVITSNEDMPDINAIIKKAVKNDDELNAFIEEIIEKGDEYFATISSKMKDFENLQMDFAKKIQKGELRQIPKEILAFNQRDKIFFFSKSFTNTIYTILDYLVQKGDMKQVKLVAEVVPSERENLFDAAVQNDKKEMALELAPYADEIKKVLPLLHDDINNLPDIIPVIKRIEGLDKYRNFRACLYLFRQSNAMQDEKAKQECQKELKDIILNNFSPLLVYRVTQEENDILLSPLREKAALLISGAIKEKDTDIIGQIIDIVPDDELFNQLINDIDKKVVNIVVSCVQRKVKETVELLLKSPKGKIKSDDFTMMVFESWGRQIKDLQEIASQEGDKEANEAKGNLIKDINKNIFKLPKNSTTFMVALEAQVSKEACL